MAVLFVFDRNILGALKDRDDRRVTFIHRSLVELDQRLRELGSRLVVRVGDPVEVVPAVALEARAEAVVAAKDFEGYAKRRDAAVARELELVGKSLLTVKDHVVFEGSEISTGEGEPFRVFTPYSKAWRRRFGPGDVAVREWRPGALVPAADLPGDDPWSLPDLGFRESELWTAAGEEAGRLALRDFATNRMAAYATNRDFPDLNATSGLSVHLRFGTVSVRETVRTALEVGGPSAEKWLDELIWREFYSMILDRFPHVEHTTFRQEYQAVEWPGTPEHFEAWCEGWTGYPIVDAAMRCLVQTGWMHNRLRMVAASFLVKDLLLNYSWGEAFFARHLLDFDLASNNGGWQWAASTGVDALPTFRIFNPVLQSRKFDPDGAFIRKWCPEVAHLDSNAIHAPWEHGGPLPIVDHATQRQHALNLLQVGTGSMNA